MRIATANVNGIRAAARKGGLAELLAADCDVITLQEVRSSPVQLAESLSAAGFGAASAVHAPGAVPGRNGVAVVAREPIIANRVGLPGLPADGRWIEATTNVAGHPLIVVSAYVPKGHAGGPPQDVKMQFLAAMTQRMGELAQDGTDVLVTGDLNVARTADDLKNWRQRIGKSGFLPQEQEHLQDWEDSGWGDVGRRLAGPGPGPYTWWSQRGRAFDNDTGWRIDYVWASADLASRAVSQRVLRAASWDTRWSDHAALVTDFTDRRTDGHPQT